MQAPLAYHITFGTYGTRLHGDERGTVDRSRNRPGEPIVGRNDDWRRFELDRLNFPPVFLTDDERLPAQTLAQDICVRGGWVLHAVAAQHDHLHILLSAPPERDPEVIRKLLKRWLHQALDSTFPDAIPRDAWPTSTTPRGDAAAPRSGRGRPGSDATPTWWAEGGSIRWVWDHGYFARVLAYVQEQRHAAAR